MSQTPDIEVAVASGARYGRCESVMAANRNVYLTAQNNNYNSEKYWVSGYWDEETGIFRRHNT